MSQQLQVSQLFPSKGISATLVKIENQTLLLDCGIAFPFEECIHQYKKIINQIDTIVITGTALNQCGALPFLIAIYQRNVYWAQPLDKLLNYQFDNIKLQLSRDYNFAKIDSQDVNCIPGDATNQIMSPSRHRSMETYKFLNILPSLNILLIPAGFGNFCVVIKHDYFSQSVFYGQKILSQDRLTNSMFNIHKVTEIIDKQNLESVIFMEQHQIPGLQSYDIIMETLETNHIFIPTDGFAHFAEAFQQIFRDRTKRTALQQLKIMLLVDKSIKVSFETFVKDIKLYDIDKMKQQGYYIDIKNNIEKINEYNIIFCMDDQFVNGFSRKVLESDFVRNNSNKILLMDPFLTPRSVPMQMIAGKLKKKSDFSVKTQLIVPKIMDRNITDEKVVLEKHEIFVSDYIKDSSLNIGNIRQKLIQTIDIENSLKQFQQFEINQPDDFLFHVRQNDMINANQKVLMFTKQEILQILNFCGNRAQCSSRFPCVGSTNLKSTIYQQNIHSFKKPSNFLKYQPLNQCISPLQNVEYDIVERTPLKLKETWMLQGFKIPISIEQLQGTKPDPMLIAVQTFIARILFSMFEISYSEQGTFVFEKKLNMSFNYTLAQLVPQTLISDAGSQHVQKQSKQQIGFYKSSITNQIIVPHKRQDILLRKIDVEDEDGPYQQNEDIAQGVLQEFKFQISCKVEISQMLDKFVPVSIIKELFDTQDKESLRQLINQKYRTSVQLFAGNTNYLPRRRRYSLKSTKNASF